MQFVMSNFYFFYFTILRIEKDTSKIIFDEITLAWNLKDDLKVLQDSLKMIFVVLRDAKEQ